MIALRPCPGMVKPAGAAGIESGEVPLQEVV